MTMTQTAFLTTALVATMVASSVAWPAVFLTDAQSKAKGAVCLDGTNPVMYIGKANTTESANKWVLYFKGGGWCYDEDSCASRAKSPLGSTAHVASDFSFGGVDSDDAAVNPLMASWNHVVLWYCDGASFSGDKTEPYYYAKTNQTLYFRGKRVMDAMIETLMTEHGLDTAEEVLVSGGSAGGLSTYLHADYVGTKMPPSVKKFKAAPNSGFFLLHDTYSGQSLYPNELEYVYHMQNSSGGVNPSCAAALKGTPDAWRCIFANYSYAYSSTPMFPLQSALDSWQMGNIFQLPGSCTKGQFDNCTPAEIDALNGYASDLVNDYQRTAKWNRPGEGGFVESCLEHVAAQGNNFDVYTINGVTEVDAFTKWWQSDNEPASNHWYWPCKLSSTAPHQCNPTCGAKRGGCAPDDLSCH
eukprot:m.181293 g.181293  ORF g.181293 m.181293 type:complete len:413 (-) comp15219_c0_seq1:237-1475(-)